jgi:RND family efflux transporter MFP subunit
MIVPAAVLAAACGGTTPAAEPQRGTPVAVQTVTVSTAALTDTFDVGGTVRARTVAAVSSRILSPVVQVAVRPGDRVRRGQPLVRLDARQLDSGTTSADATLAGALDSATAAASEEAAAQSALTLAKATYTRVSQLYERTSATTGELDDATATLNAAQARLDGAKARRAGADRAIEASRGSARSANVAASYAVLSAPFDGLVTETPAQEGMMAAPGMPLVTVEDTSKYRLEVSVDSTRAGLIRAGSHVPVRLGESTGTLDGVVSEVTESVSPSEHAFVVKIDLPAVTGLRTGLFGRASFQSSGRRGIAVPSTAVVRRGQLAIVFTEEAGVARMRVVQLGEPAGDVIHINAGLTDGDRVIVSPPADLADGRAVSASGIHRLRSGERQ